MSGTVRWGVLSTADIGVRKVIPGIRQAARCEVVAIASRDATVARSVADRLAIPTAHPTYEDLLADPGVDAVYIPLPNHLHAEWTIAALRAGKHVLCEKPLAMTADDAQRMVDVAHETGRHLMEAFMYRHHPSWVAAMDLVQSGRIGTLTAVQTWFSYYNDDPTNIRNIREYGGGALFDIGCYAVNLSRMVFGGEPSRVQASLRRDPVSGVDVLTAGLLDFEGGIAAFTCSTRAEDDQRVDIYGTTGRISIEIPFNIPPDRPTRIRVTAGGDPPVAPDTDVLEFATMDPYTAEAERFASAILDGGPTPVPPEDAVANLRVIEDIFAVADRRAERAALSP
ncbi:MAG TPA: Gfo/Idh/MocA family oxidoreductase, partial [Candidatus Limnocylindrales bacterium]|nr:Gfo/Idh/MocA family oxidoreductase [Candidatus Limnocylindrales bacterium]